MREYKVIRAASAEEFEKQLNETCADRWDLTHFCMVPGPPNQIAIGALYSAVLYRSKHDDAS